MLTLDQVVAAGAEVGLADLSMTSVAQRLGVSAPTLYGYVPDRHSLELIVAERMMNDFELPVDDGLEPRELLVAFAVALWARLRSVSGLAEAVARHGGMPVVADRVHRIVARLVERGLDETSALVVSDAVTDLTIAQSSMGSTGAGLSARFGTGSLAEERFRWLVEACVDGLLNSVGNRSPRWLVDAEGQALRPAPMPVQPDADEKRIDGSPSQRDDDVAVAAAAEVRSGGRRTGRTSPGPKPLHSRDDVAAAALEVGFERLTMSTVAERLGVSRAAMYKYVRDRDDLIHAAIDRLIAKTPLSDATDWIDLLRHEAHARWDGVIAHPGLMRADFTSGYGRGDLAGPAHNERDRREVENLRRLGLLGLNQRDALLALRMVVDLASDGMVSIEDALGVPEGTSGESSTQAPGVDGPEAIAPDRAMIDERRWFEDQLDVVLRGLRHRFGQR